jgi:hypothetical protein
MYDLNNDRGITLTWNVYKVYAKIIEQSVMLCSIHVPSNVDNNKTEIPLHNRVIWKTMVF